MDAHSVVEALDVSSVMSRLCLVWSQSTIKWQLGFDFGIFGDMSGNMPRIPTMELHHGW